MSAGDWNTYDAGQRHGRRHTVSARKGSGLDAVYADRYRVLAADDEFALVAVTDTPHVDADAAADLEQTIADETPPESRHQSDPDE